MGVAPGSESRVLPRAAAPRTARATLGAIGSAALLRGVGAVLAAEALDAASGVHELLLARVERVARGADLDVDAFDRRAGIDDVTARTDDLRRLVGRMNTFLHGRCSFSREGEMYSNRAPP